MHAIHGGPEMAYPKPNSHSFAPGSPHPRLGRQDDYFFKWDNLP